MMMQQNTRYEQFKNIALPALISAAAMTTAAMIKQGWLAKVNPTAVTVRMILTGIIPTNFGVLQPMLSEVFKKRNTLAYKPERIGPVFQMNTALGLLCCVAAYPMFANAGSFLNWLNNIAKMGLMPEDISTVQAALPYDYANIVLTMFLNNAMMLLFQSRHFWSGAGLSVLYEGLGLLSTYIFMNTLQMGFQGWPLSDLVTNLASSAMAISLMLSLKELKSYHLFDVGAEARSAWWPNIKETLRLGSATWTAELVNLASEMTVSLAFSPPGLIGGLNVAANAANNVTNTVTDVASPFIAESEGMSQRQAINKQYLYGMVPNLLVFALALAFAPALADSMGGASANNMSDNELRTFVALFLGSQLIFGNFFGIAYQTCIDRSDTLIPAGITIAASLLMVGACYGFQDLLGVGDPRIGSFATFVALGLGAPVLMLYNYYKTKEPSPVVAPAAVADHADEHAYNEALVPFLSAGQRRDGAAAHMVLNPYGSAT